MNFLAHSLFGYSDDALITGQFCGDFVRGSKLSHLPRGIEVGIRLHRRMDAFTDAHEALKPAKVTLGAGRRRVSGIIVDVMFDHWLAVNWPDFSDLGIDQHVKAVHQAVRKHDEYIPAELARFMRFLHNEKVLESNGELAAIALTLGRLSSRSPRFASLAMNVEELEPLARTLDAPFRMFYPELDAAASGFLQQYDYSPHEQR